ncbi:MAG: endonuclease NucS [Hydrogenovibrio sp.]|uniref:endonuclease NucS domain-containing protein n=1 Tax=Hydrogenovibrio sp. TaxID=2065821 RepID=UPI00286FECBD|nr:endonuclease NucS domain-containing protein [Hydrogenovibrio sp.]MDR9497895.1 endonuclease NucS [Hydrogenovibrio sp.]
MASLYDKPVRALMHDMVRDINLKPDFVISRDRVRSWFRQNYPKIKDGTIAAHLLRMSVNSKSRVHYGAKPGEDDLFFQLDPRHFRLYQSQNDPVPIYQRGDVEKAVEEEVQDLVGEGSPEFAYEKDLQNYLARNLHLIETGLTLFKDEGINGLEFPVGGRFIDILATDSEGNYVVIELKVSKGYDRVVGQLLRYMAWIRKNQTEPGQLVRGIIVARHISEDLLLACSGVQGVQLFEYELSVSLREARLE